MDKPGTIEEKYEIMKNDMITRGKWNEQSEKLLKTTLGIIETNTEKVVIEEKEKVMNVFEQPLAVKKGRKKTK